jgi:hypothetical protein
MKISINSYNTTSDYIHCQQNYYSSQNIPYSSKIYKELFQLKSNGNRKGIANVFNELLYRYNTGKSMKVSQQAIGTKVKLTRLQVGELLRDLERIGVISIDRVHHQSSTYHINPIFFEKEVRNDLKYQIPELNDDRI